MRLRATGAWNHDEDDMPREDGGRSADKGGKGKGGPRKDGRGRGAEAKPVPANAVRREQLVDKVGGVSIFKISDIDTVGRRELSKSYTVVFEGHDPIAVATLGGARERAKEPAPERMPEPEPAGGSAADVFETAVPDAA